MDEKNRPALSVNPCPSELVCTNASSTDALLSAAKARFNVPLNQGSIFAVKPSSDSAMEKPRVPGPICASGGSAKPLIRYVAGSRLVCVYRPDRIRDKAGLKPVPDEGVVPASATATDGGGAA